MSESTRTTLRELFLHNDWARDRLLSWVDTLSDEQLDKPFEMGPGSLRLTLYHLWLAERAWLDRWKEHELKADVHADRSISLDALRTRFVETARERDAFLDENAETRRIRFTNAQGREDESPLGDMMLHVTNHGVHHRAQALNMLRHLGIKVSGLDYLFMRCEQPTVLTDEASRRNFRERGFEIAETCVAPARFEMDVLNEAMQYGDWATSRVTEAAASLSNAQLDQPFEMGTGTLRATIAHVLDGEQWWYHNWTEGHERPFEKMPPDTPLAEIEQQFAAAAAQRNEYLATQTDADLQRETPGQVAPGMTLNCRLGESLVQLSVHGTHHRAQARNMLRRLGTEMTELDFRIYQRDA